MSDLLAGGAVPALLAVASADRSQAIAAPGLVGGSVLLLALGIVAGVAVATGRLTRSLRGANASIERLAAGDLSARLDERGPAEVAALASTVNRMATTLRDRIADVADARQLRDLILSSMEEGILLAGPDDAIAFANPSAERHLGRLPEGASTLPPALRAAVAQARSDGNPVSVETELGAPTRTLRGLASPVGSHGSVLLVVRDVTEAKRLDAVRRDFVTNASHELKTPAAAIQAVAETIRRATRSDPEVIPRFAEQLEREAIRLSRIVSDLLDLSRLESGSDLDAEVRIDEIAREEAARLGSAAEQAGLTLTVDAQPAGRVRGSPRDLSLLVRNLVDNAIRWTRSGGTVRVRVDAHDGETRLQVEDTGIGIPSRDLPRIFERFYRVDRARSRDTGGTGLGLAIVRHVAENHGGSVRVESELGRGTTFEVRLPSMRSENGRPDPTEDRAR